jgi:probable HAF family extracellular repeat protein
MILLALGALVAAAAAPSASAPRWQIMWVTANAKGAEFRIASVADDGSFAGTLTQPNRAKSVLFYNGQTVRDLGAKIGPGSVARGMNNRHQIVGYRSTEPDGSFQPHGFLYGGKVKTLSQPFSTANAVNDAGVVVGSFLGPDQQLHAFAWLNGGLRWAPVGKGNFIDLGVGTAVSVNNPSTSWNVQIVGSVEGAAGYYTLNVRTRKFKAQKLSFPGELNAVNTASRAGGYSLSPTHNLLPVVVNLRTKAATRLSLPQPFTDGTVNAVTEAGDALGELSDPTGNLEAVRWAKGKGAPANLNALFTRKQLRSGKLTNLTDASASGLVSGTGTISGAAAGFVAFPPASLKLAQLLGLVTQTGQKIYARGTRSAISKAYGAARRGASPCAQVDKAIKANYADLRKVGFYARNSLVDGLDEVKYGLQCPGKIRPPRGMPFLNR